MSNVDVKTKKFTAEEVINAGGTATCRLCEDAFRRKVETWRFCKRCGNGFCEGQHGNFAYGFGTCVVCGSRKNYSNAATYDTLKGERLQS
jgi:hydrogenase maturation factor HypF (carbamoyltransferase family)